MRIWYFYRNQKLIMDCISAGLINQKSVTGRVKVECGKDRVLKKLSALIAVLGSFALVACYPSSENKEEVKMDNEIPITGFERNIKIDLDGTLLSVPYGYLAGSSRDSATRWMSDEEKIYKGGRFDIYVHAKRKGDSWILEPFNRKNKDKFVKALKDGLPMIDTISIQKNSECLLDPKYLKKMILRYGSKEITSSKDYKAYERFNEEPFYHEFNYIRDDENPVRIQVRDDGRKNGKRLNEPHFSIAVDSCINGLSVDYYPSISVHEYGNFSKQLSQQELIEYHLKIEKLIKSFIK